MRFFSILFSILLIASASFAQQQPVAPSADEVAKGAWEVLAGGGAWEHARYFSYTFVVQKGGKTVASFPQKWDRMTGDYSVSGKRPDGLPFEATINVFTKKVHGSVQGRTLTDRSQLQELYGLAYTRFLNDTLWLLMPLKMFDPGFNRAYEGVRTDSCGHTWDVLKVTVEPQKGIVTATYYPWINRDTKMVEEWDMKLDTMPADQPPIEVLFHDYRRIGGLLISVQREVRGQDQTVRLDHLQILPEPPKDAFK